MMAKKTFELIRNFPAYAVDPVEYERAIRHNHANPSLTRQQLIDLSVMSAIEVERLMAADKEARIDEHEIFLHTVYLQKYAKGVRPKGQHIVGGNKTKGNSIAHKEHIKSAVVERLKQSDSQIKNYLVKHGLDKFKDRTKKSRQLQTYIAEIRAESEQRPPII